jgi:MFS family permease
MAILGVPMLLGPILGPIIGGWLIDHASWHWIFLINAPIGVVALIYAFVALPSDSPEPSESFDFLGMLLLSPGLALFLFGVSSLPQEGGDFTAPRVWLSMLVGVALMLTFVWHAFRPEHRRRSPRAAWPGAASATASLARAPWRHSSRHRRTQ